MTYIMTRISTDLLFLFEYLVLALLSVELNRKSIVFYHILHSIPTVNEYLKLQQTDF